MFGQPSATRQLAQVRRRCARLQAASDVQLREQSMTLRFRAAAGEALTRLLPDAYALVHEASRRTLGMTHYDVQIIGGIHLARRSVIEMETGQGKTLTATMPLYLYSLCGKGAHLATSNDYLAERDADTMRPMFDLLGTSVGLVASGMDDNQRRDNYRCDITYGTNAEFGFDFLRDRMKQRESNTRPTIDNTVRGVQRGLFFILADEADALMVDEANTPMVIGVEGKATQQKQAIYHWAAANAPAAIENRHFRYLLREQRVELLQEGRQWVRTRLPTDGSIRASVLEMYERLERAILVHRDYHRDRQYIVRDGKIVLINESTGRLGEDRQMHDGIHQAIEASENLEITLPMTHAAKMTVQSLFLAYEHLAGMTGTAVSARAELQKVYKTKVVRVPPRHRSRRQALPTKYFADDERRWQAICDEVKAMNQIGRPVLIGTRSVSKSHHLSQLLDRAGVKHQVLNARHHASEAEIVAAAGQRSCVTVATSMAGRGTDIKIDDDVAQLGGLHVILTELNDSPRQDQQLIGRCGRQGQPGTHRQFLCPEDEILDLALGPAKAQAKRRNVIAGGASMLLSAQQLLETRRRQNRLAALYHEKRRLRSIWEMGRDPLLDAM